ncbi:MAG: type VI secretion system-associated protein TagF [Nitrosospira sp.]
MDRDESLVAGWYGKIPSLGDFASRRLPASFIKAWDLWLQHGMAASRAQLRERWLNLYLTGPIWRFVVMPGACSGEPSLWAGVLMPSVDKVGRYFPLTIALRVEPRPGAMLTIFSAQSWFADLERLALATLDINVLPEELDRSLAESPFPAPEPGRNRSYAQELAAWWQAGAETGTPKALALPTAHSLADLFDATAEDLLYITGSGKSFWWAVSPKAGPTQLRCFTGLPPENYFSAMLEDTAPYKNANDFPIVTVKS